MSVPGNTLLGLRSRPFKNMRQEMDADVCGCTSLSCTFGSGLGTGHGRMSSPMMSALKKGV